MPFYFEYFPVINYDMNKDGKPISATNIMKRFKIIEKIRHKAALFYTYEIEDSERPDIVASKFYNDSEKDWIILMTNKVLDPRWEWAMGYYDFKEFVKGKYGSIETAEQTNHHYEKILQSAETLFDGTVIAERVVIIDFTTYGTTPDASRRAVSKYDYERDLNESRRSIKIIKEQYIPEIITEFEKVFNS